MVIDKQLFYLGHHADPHPDYAPSSVPPKDPAGRKVINVHSTPKGFEFEFEGHLGVFINEHSSAFAVDTPENRKAVDALNLTTKRLKEHYEQTALLREAARQAAKKVQTL